jgi:hypothetical protein
LIKLTLFKKGVSIAERVQVTVAGTAKKFITVNIEYIIEQAIKIESASERFLHMLVVSPHVFGMGSLVSCVMSRLMFLHGLVELLEELVIVEVLSVVLVAVVAARVEAVTAA